MRDTVLCYRTSRARCIDVSKVKLVRNDDVDISPNHLRLAIEGWASLLHFTFFSFAFLLLWSSQCSSFFFQFSKSTSRTIWYAVVTGRKET